MFLLGITPSSEVLLIGAPDGYRHLLDPSPEAVHFASQLSESTDVIHLFSARRAELETALSIIRAGMKLTAILWVSWPKKSSKVPTDITEDTVRAVALPLGLVDIKVGA